MNACTIIARNYLAHARVLAKSFLQHHPDGNFSVLLLDDPGEELPLHDELFRVVRPREILEPEEFDCLSLIYDVSELATAVKPWLLRHLLKDGREDIVFFDPDVQIFAPLDDIAELAHRHSIVLTPHNTEPMPRDDRDPSELYVLQSGTYNLGFIALGRETSRFLDWWSDRLRRDCVAAPERGLFVDQRWIDLVPGYFQHYLLKDPGCNVAYWNLSNRELSWNGGRYEVDGKPLRFFHFSGFAPENPVLLTKHAVPAPRVLMSQNAALRRICHAYADRLFEQGYDRSSRQTYGLGALRNGLPVDRHVRRLYREALLAFERDGGKEPPKPYEDPEAFVRWLNEPVLRSPAGGISRYLHAVYAERPDLKAAFPNLSSSDGGRFLAWVLETGRREAKIPRGLLPSPSWTRERPKGEPRQGVNIAGYFRAELGVGEAARQLVATLSHAGVPHATVTIEETVSRQRHPFPDGEGETPYDINLVCVNADMLPACAKRLGDAFFEGRHSIGLWHWEVSEFPDAWHASFDYVDEIWVPSEHTAAFLSAISPKPVHVVPLPVTPPSTPPDSTRTELGIPKSFLFLFVYDFMSVFERKNPLGLLKAFRRAFAPGEGPVLVLKSINGDKRIEQLERLRLAAEEEPDVLVLDGYYSPEATRALMASCDCYVSLHRAEGFGLTLAEAMALGKPVIATGYSGNMMFMSEDNAFLVRYRPGRVPDDCAPYPPDSEWAEPDIEHAATLMRHVFEHPEEALEKGERARNDILSKHSPQACAETLVRRLEESRREQKERRADGPPLSRVAARAAAFPGTHWKRGRFRPFLPLARSLLFRLLRPYTEKLQGVHESVSDALEELRERVEGLGRDRIPALRNEILTTQERLSRQLEGLHGCLARLERDLGASRKAQERFDGRLEPLADDVARTSERQGGLERHLEKLVRDVSEFQEAAKAHLGSSTRSVEWVERSLDRPARELYALPYTAESMRIRANGTETIGYHSASGDDGARPDVYPGFEDLFRGPEALVRDRLRGYLDLVKEHEPLVDLGCGRGEFLDLLAEQGKAGVGVDVDPGMVERSRRNGHRVELADAADYLAAQPDRSIGCIFSAHLIEHLPFDSLLSLLRLSKDKLVPEGLFVAETVNPHSLAALKCFWTDLSHQKPIFPEVAVALCRLHAFGSARILFPRGKGTLEEDLWAQGEYALLASVSEKKDRRGSSR